jgi:hypothetical protein
VPEPLIIGAWVAYFAALLAANPVLARAWTERRISLRQLAIARAVRWSTIPLAVLFTTGNLLSPLGAILVVGTFRGRSSCISGCFRRFLRGRLSSAPNHVTLRHAD